MKEWIELIANADRVAVRPENIVMYETQAGGYTRILVDSGSLNEEVIVSEPFEKVKQKIADAEEIDLSNIIVEHFTKEQYELLLEAVGFFEASCTQTQDNVEFAKSLKPLATLKESLNQILSDWDH